MTTYYLLPVRSRSPALVTALVKRLDTTGKKADHAAQEYQQELNGGETSEQYLVIAEPYSTARAYTSFRNWGCNQGDE